jgi:pimeloyl-ACP methyl ester carboxylesterase
MTTEVQSFRMREFRIDVPVESFFVRSADGLAIRAHRVGTGPHRWLIPPGMGTPLLCWKHIFEHFSDRMTLVTWDQRGCYGSEHPRCRSELRFDRHVEDGLAVLDALGWHDRFVTGSWSMGVQLGLALYERMPERIAALTLINGACGNVLRTAYGGPSMAPLRRLVLDGTLLASPLLAPLARRLLQSGRIGQLMDRLAVSTANAAFVTAVTRKLAELDLGNYVAILRELDRHTNEHVLESVRVPTLVTAGSKDVATPPPVMAELHRRIAGSRYVVIDRGTHYTPLEYPAELNRALEQFFAQVFAQSWDRA